MQTVKRMRFILLYVASLSIMLVFCSYDKFFDVLKSMPLVGWLIAYNFPPADYYVPCATFQLSEIPCTKYITCRYKGRYDIHIHNILTNQLSTSNVSLHISLTNEDGRNILYVKDRGDSGAFAYYNRDGVFGYRYFFLSFNVPDEVPANKRLNLTIFASGAVKDFLSLHPMAEIEVVKCFDK